MGEQRRLTPEDLLAIRTIEDAQISPDGSRVAYVVKRAVLEDNRYASEIRIVAINGGDEQVLENGGKKDSAPRWSPDGARLAFVSDREGPAQLYIRDGDGESRQLTDLSRGVSNPVWSPDGSRIAVLSSEGYGIDDETRGREGGFIRHVKRLQYRFNEADYIDDRFNHIWIVDIESGETSRLTAGEASIGSIAWSPDGTRIAFTANRLDEANSSFRSQLYVIDANSQLDGETDSAVVISAGSEMAAGPAWSPDGSSIAFVGRREGARAGANNEIYLAKSRGGSLNCITERFDRSPMTSSFSDTWGPRDHTPLIWRPDGTDVLFTASDKGRVGIYCASADGSHIEPVIGGNWTVGYVSQSANGEWLAFVASSFSNPCDLYVHRFDGSEEHRLTDLNVDVLDDLPTQGPHHFTFESPASDEPVEIDAWLIRPVDYDESQRYPLVQIIHGGPHSIFGHTFFFDMQLWANQGWNVLFINPRATQGYGEAFATAILGAWGVGDWPEQERALDLAIEQGGVDPEHLAVTGLSYGGFMTNWIVGQTNRYNVAVSENSISNLVSFFTTADIGWYWLETEMEKTVWDNLDWYMQASPISYVPNMTTPMLLLQAEADYRCPIEQGEQLYTALRARGIPTEMVRFPGESHGQLSIGKPETRLVRRQVTLDWFRRFL